VGVRGDWSVRRHGVGQPHGDEIAVSVTTCSISKGGLDVPARDTRAEGGQMKVIEYRGTSYPCPLSGEFRRHNGEEREAMRKSVAEVGVLQAVRLYRDAESGEVSVLDGEGRLETAAELDADVPFVDDGEMSFAAAYQAARVLNDARRHDDRDAIRRREERVKRVVAKRADGMSVRAIADVMEIDPKQVQRDLRAAAGVDSVHTCQPPESAADGKPADKPAPAAPPPKVIGRDGKKYAASSPQRPKAPIPEPPATLAVSTPSPPLPGFVCGNGADAEEPNAIAMAATDQDLVPFSNASCESGLSAMTDGLADDHADRSCFPAATSAAIEAFIRHLHLVQSDLSELMTYEHIAATIREVASRHGVKLETDGSYLKRGECSGIPLVARKYTATQVEDLLALAGELKSLRNRNDRQRATPSSAERPAPWEPGYMATDDSREIPI
jgi:hypothetical protein